MTENLSFTVGMMDGRLACHAELSTPKNLRGLEGKTEALAVMIGWSEVLSLMTGLNITETTIEQYGLRGVNV